MTKNSISILGCGWLGFPLGLRLIKEGYQVKGSTTSHEKLALLNTCGIEPYFVLLNPQISTVGIPKFLDSDILIINIPPNRNTEVIESFPAQITSLITEIKKSQVEKVIFISSTSVYGENNNVITEDSKLEPTSNSGRALLITERLLRSETTFATAIIRFGGLIGPDRHPGRFLAGRQNLSGGNAKINLIHQDDCIEIIIRIIKQNVWNEIFNACAVEHPTKKEFYTYAAERLGLEPPKFSEIEQNYKIIDSTKLKEKLNYKFIHSDPMNMI